ncbi:MAG: hypothetical protein J5938_03885 [Clostridia bacterium]|nr:hypothetical protein [Clostridia bacterium]MBQ4290060.1 hypothetical protein [Clostridia bacterium]
MGFLSKLLGGNASEGKKAVESFLQGLMDGVGKQDSNASAGAQTAGKPEEDKTVFSSSVSDSPCGDSWGERMPDEPNQFNSGLSYPDYFEKIFREEFPSFECTKEFQKGGKRVVFFLRSAGKTALVAEILPQSSASKKLRENCHAQGTPYLRFYYDHEGWWNTRSYVVRRVREAMASR